MNIQKHIDKARWIQFPKKGNEEIGYLGIASVKSGLPFELKRSFWTKNTPENVIRGKHAHYHTEMVLIALHGEICLNLEYLDTTHDKFILKNPYQGIFIPRLSWHDIQYGPNAIQLVLTNSLYKESDYIRDEKMYRELQQQYSKRFLSI